MNFIGQYFVLKEMPQLRFGNPPLTIGKAYLIKGVDGSNFILDDDDGEQTSIGSCRFQIT